MAIEIERKFLLSSDDWRQQVGTTQHIAQAYLAVSPLEQASSSVRVRICDDCANINVKGMTLGIQRTEFEYPIPIEDAQTMLGRLCQQPVLEKYRHIVEMAGHRWEIDEFLGENTGLIVAEIELTDLDEPFERPAWLGEEVSDDPRYYNVLLVSQPFSSWQE